MAYASSEGLRIFYETVGDGPPLLMFHGSLVSGEIWRVYDYVDALTSDFRLILIDARGHGASDKPLDSQTKCNSFMTGDCNGNKIQSARYRREI
jgi:pimeloyl-ACP methyl ester carboxylesterase